MDSKICEAELIEKFKIMAREVIKPEPQISTFYKYLAMKADGEMSKEDFITHITNSHGIHIRNDISFWKEKRAEGDCKDVGAPVLDPEHLNSFASFSDIVKKLSELPEEWSVVQISKTFTPRDVLRNQTENCGTDLAITRFYCGKLANRIQPYYVNIGTEQNLIGILTNLAKIRREYFTSRGVSRSLKQDYPATEFKLTEFLRELENNVLREWRSLLGGRLEDKELDGSIRIRVSEALGNFQKKIAKTPRISEESFDFLYHVTLSAHGLKNKEMVQAINYALFDNELEASALLPLVNDLKSINLANSCAVKRANKNPVILIVDSALELIPWEMVSVLSGQPVCRILSLHLLYALFKYHKPHIVDGYRRIKIDSGFCLVNPGKDLTDCEKVISQFLKTEMPWMDAEIGEVPDPNVYLSRFRGCAVMCYCGHGSGGQYLKSSELKNSFVKGIVLLFGCSSNMPRSTGGRTPCQNDTYTFITNGCPCLVGCLYDIRSQDADKACQKMLSSFLPTYRNQDSKMVIRNNNVLRGVSDGKSDCDKPWSRSAFIVRGIPCKTEADNIPVPVSTTHQNGAKS